MRGSSASADDGPDSVLVPVSITKAAGGNIERHRRILLDQKDAGTGTLVEFQDLVKYLFDHNGCQW